jgi:hypothetical protein
MKGPLFSISAILRDVLYLSWLLPTERVRARLPPGLSLMPLPRAPGRAWVSAVLMNCHAVRVAYLPWPRFTYAQFNARTYVRDPATGNPAAFFFFSAVSQGTMSRLASWNRLTWENIELAVSLDENLWRAEGHWRGPLAVEASIDEAPGGPLAHFPGPAGALEELVLPQVGFYRSGPRLARLQTRHPETPLHATRPEKVRLPVMVESGLLTRTEIGQPDSAFLVREAPFRAWLPPAFTRLKK